jgi:hypothetical protein
VVLRRPRQELEVQLPQGFLQRNPGTFVGQGEGDSQLGALRRPADCTDHVGLEAVGVHDRTDLLQEVVGRKDSFQEDLGNLFEIQKRINISLALFHVDTYKIHTSTKNSCWEAVRRNRDKMADVSLNQISMILSRFIPANK